MSNPLENSQLNEFGLKQNNNSIGRAGEYLAAMILEMHGITTVISNLDGADLFCRKQRHTFQVEVKTAMRPAPKKPNFISFCTRSKVRSDVFCFVWLPQKMLICKPAVEVTVTNVKIRRPLFNADEMHGSILRSFNT